LHELVPENFTTICRGPTATAPPGRGCGSLVVQAAAMKKQESLALVGMARDMIRPQAARRQPAARRPMRGKVGSEFET